MREGRRGEGGGREEEEKRREKVESITMVISDKICICKTLKLVLKSVVRLSMRCCEHNSFRFDTVYASRMKPIIMQ